MAAQKVSGPRHAVRLHAVGRSEWPACRRLRVEHEGTIAVVTLAQPPANAMDAASLNELADVFEGLAGEPDVGRHRDRPHR